MSLVKVKRSRDDIPSRVSSHVITAAAEGDTPTLVEMKGTRNKQK